MSRSQPRIRRPVTTAAACAPEAPASRLPVAVSLADLDVAPENLRSSEAPDDDIAHLAETLAAAGLLQYPTVRPGRRGEARHMVLDGRRRLLALRRLRDAGRIDEHHPVPVFVETDRGRQAAAVVLTNTAAPVHVADVIAAIGRMLKARLGVQAIAGALGYGETEIRRLAALSALPPVALEALKGGTVTLRQARLLARLQDAEEQAALAQSAIDGHGLPEWRIQERLKQGRITIRDPRCGLVTPSLYAAKGGRTELDLFGELPPVLLDPGHLTRAWLKRARPIADRLEAEGLTVRLLVGEDEDEDAGGPPDDMERLFYAYGGLSEAEADIYRETRERAQAAADAVEAALAPTDPPPGKAEDDGDEGLEAVIAFVRARIAQDQAGSGQRLAVLVAVRPSLRTGVEVDCYAPVESRDEKPLEEPEESRDGAPDPLRSAWVPPLAAAPLPETDGISHVLHAVRTDTATRGLIRALAGEPSVALTVLVARLFACLAVWPPVSRDEAALSITAATFAPANGRIIAGLDGVVREQLDERRRAWEASGLTLIAWIHGLHAEDRFALMAELTALSLDLHEGRSGQIRRRARAEAAEIAALCRADISRWWTPDGAYLRPHSRDQLMSMLEDMEAPTAEPGRMRKGDLVVWVEDQAAARGWTPSCLSWTGREGARGEGAVGAEAKPGEVQRAEDGGRGVFIVTPEGAAALDEPGQEEADPGDATPDLCGGEAA